MTASIREVAQRAGVSIGTVSNVLNRPDIVAPATRERVQAAIVELGFIRNESARQLRAGRGRALGLVVLDVANPFFTDVARGVEATAERAGLIVILCNSDDQPEREDRYLDMLEEQRVQGVLITPAMSTDSRRLRALRERRIPVVLLDRRGSRAGQCSVAVDDKLGGELAVDHLIERGHTRIAYLTGPLTIQQARDRRDGALRALARAGLPAQNLVIAEAAGLTFEHGRMMAEDLVGRADRPSAVFCANDLLAMGMLQATVAHRIPVPEEMAIVGYDDIDFAAAAAVPLSSVRQPRHQLGQTAAELLIDEATNTDKHRHQQVLFTPELVVRASSGG